MRRPTKRKLALKARVLASSAAMAKTNGLSALSVDTVMGGVRRTGSTFYTLFGSKKEFVQTLLEHELARSRERFSGPARFPDLLDEWIGTLQKFPRRKRGEDAIDDWMVSVLMPYLGENHVNSPEDGCALAAFSADIGRAGSEAKKAYEDAIAQIVDVFKNRTGCPDTVAWAAIIQCLGAVIVARALASELGRSMALHSSSELVKNILKGDAVDKLAEG